MIIYQFLKLLESRNEQLEIMLPVLNFRRPYVYHFRPCVKMDVNPLGRIELYENQEHIHEKSLYSKDLISLIKYATKKHREYLTDASVWGPYSSSIQMIKPIASVKIVSNSIFLYT